MTARPGEHVRLSEVDLARVAAFLRSNGLDFAAELTATLIAGGRSNLTFLLDDGQSHWVLRMPPRVGRTPSAHDVVREHRVTAALGGTEVPVARALALCQDESLGGPFTITEFVPGRTVQSREDLAGLDDCTLQALMVRFVEVLVALHQVDHEAVGLGDFGRPDGYAERQIRRWAGQWDLVGIPDLDAAAIELGNRLRSSVPEQLSTGIVHGDFRIDNAILRLEESPSIAAIVDWELSTIGDPVADVAMMCAYRDPAFDLILGAPSAWTSARLPDAEELAAAYVEAGGTPLVAWDFHMALAYFKIGVISAGIDHRYRAGAASGPGFDTAGAAVSRYFELGLGALGDG